MSANGLVGQPIPRGEGERLLTGRGRFTDDLMPEAAHAAFVRAELAHARIAGIDVDAALEVDGVLAIYTHEDLADGFADRLPLLLPHDGLTQPRTQPALAADEVCYAGQTIAMVVA